jgi:hypothetical protein
MLLVIGGGAPSPARASCGQDVTSNQTLSARESLFDLKLSKDLVADQANSAPAGPRRELPCSGPSCSRGQGLPSAPVTSFLVRVSDPWCCTTISSRWDDLDSVDKPVDLPIAHPRYDISRVERPPRIPQPRTLS